MNDHSLTTEQMQIVKSLPYSNICINACPGSGKTTTILYRIQYLHNHYQIPLNKIALFTYNRFLSLDMNSKLERFGINKKDLGWCGTVHAFCHRETNNGFDLRPWIKKYINPKNIHYTHIEVINQNDCSGLIYNEDFKKESIVEKSQTVVGYQFLYPTNHTLVFQDLESSDLDPNYIEQLEKFGNPNFNFNESKENYSIIIFDEYQDADSEIASVIKILSQGRSLMIVGDERQQIYGSKGANAELLLNSKPDFLKLSLSKSFRCNKHICEYISRLYPNYPKIYSSREGSIPALYRSFGSSIHEPGIIDKIKEILIEIQSYPWYKEIKENSDCDQPITVGILSPIVNGEKSKLFLTDIVSNLNVIYPKSFSFIQAGIDFSDISEPIFKGIISSVHGSKGREYDVVILLNVVDADKFYDSYEYEDLCKFFVACSRPRYELHIFEHLYGRGNGTLGWILNNQDLLNVRHCSTQPRCRANNVIVSSQSKKPSTEFIRNIDYDDRRTMISYYDTAECVGREKGVVGLLNIDLQYEGTNVDLQTLISNSKVDKKMFKILFEWLLAIRYTGKAPKMEFNLYLNSTEWRNVKNTGSQGLPQSVIDKINLVYTREIYEENQNYVGIYNDDTIFIGLYKKTESKVEFEPKRFVTVNNVVSTLICNEYYKWLPYAYHYYRHLRLSEKNGTLKIDSLTVTILWWLIRFVCLTKLSLTGFNTPDLPESLINQLVIYCNESSILSQLGKIEHSVTHSDRIDENLMITGNVEFLTEMGIVQIAISKSSIGDDPDNPWIEPILHNHLFRSIYDKNNKGQEQPKEIIDLTKIFNNDDVKGSISLSKSYQEIGGNDYNSVLPINSPSSNIASLSSSNIASSASYDSLKSNNVVTIPNINNAKRLGYAGDPGSPTSRDTLSPCYAPSDINSEDLHCKNIISSNEISTIDSQNVNIDLSNISRVTPNPCGYQQSQDSLDFKLVEQSPTIKNDEPPTMIPDKIRFKSQRIPIRYPYCQKVNTKTIAKDVFIYDPIRGELWKRSRREVN